MTALPRTLEIYLSNRCNCDCRYCSSGTIKRGQVRTLRLEDVKRGIDLFADLVGNGRQGGPARSIGLSGGEPLLEWRLVQDVVRYAARRHPHLNLSLCTNGTLLDQNKADFLLDHGVDLSLSLDGPRAVNDRSRRFWSGKGSSGRGKGRPSVFAAVMRNLDRLPTVRRREIRAVATYSSETIRALTPSVGFLVGLGFKSVELGLSVYERWPAAKLDILRKSLARFRKYCVDLQLAAGHGPRPPRVSFDTEFQRPETAGAPTEFALSVDGLFLPCDTVWRTAGGYEEYAVGDLRRGFDRRKIRRLFAGLAPLIREFGCPNNVLPPVERFFYSAAVKRDPRILLRNGVKVSGIFERELGPLLDMERVLNKILSDPGFGDLEHRSRLVSGKTVRTLRIVPGRAGTLRAALDYMLYSPGGRKRLGILGGGPADSELAEGLVLYSLLKGK